MRKLHLLAICATLLVGACAKKPKSVDKFNPNAAISVDIAIIENQTIDKQIEVNGSVLANDYIDLHPETNGRVVYLQIPEGKMVPSGTVLAKLNEDMERDIITFVAQASANTRSKEITNFKKCLTTIMQFKETGNNLFLGRQEETGYKAANFMKKTMRYLTKEFPNIITNRINYMKGLVIPKHWKLSKIHNTDMKEIIKKAERVGWKYSSYIDLTTIGFEYGYLLLFSH